MQPMQPYPEAHSAPLQQHVAWGFFLLSNLIGYPLVLQADNGSEFKGDVKELLEDVKKLDMQCVTVKNGAPRTPRHQGSLQRANQYIHLQKLLSRVTFKFFERHT
jgi:hypothetical protein